MASSTLKTTGVRRSLLQSKIMKVRSTESSKTSSSLKKGVSGQLRSSITPGTVLILLAGRFRGKRVVFLKQLESGLLLVTGPYKYNGVPIQRVNQAYVIATSTKVNISSLQFPENLTDDLFVKTEPRKNVKFLEKSTLSEEAKEKLTAERAHLQTSIDNQLIPIIKAVPHLPSYIKSLFSLRNGQAPHALKF